MQFTPKNYSLNNWLWWFFIILAIVTIVVVITLKTDLALLSKQHFKSTPVTPIKKSGLHILSFASNPRRPLLKLLLASSPYPIEVLGKNEKWRGFRHKLESVHAYLSQHHLQHSKDIIVFVDGYDVLFAPGGQDIVKKFKAFHKPIVISAEMNCWPPQAMACVQVKPDSPMKGTTPFQYVNSGTYIGYAWAINQMLTEELKKYPQEKDDQYLLHDFSFRHPETVALDQRQEIFSLLYGTQFNDFSYDQKTGLIRNDITNTTPVILHGNGGIRVLIKLYQHYFGSKASGWTNVHYYAQVLVRLGVIRVVAYISNQSNSVWLQYGRRHCHWLKHLAHKSATLAQSLSQQLRHSLLWDAYFEQLDS